MTAKLAAASLVAQQIEHRRKLSELAMDAIVACHARWITTATEGSGALFSAVYELWVSLATMEAMR